MQDPKTAPRWLAVCPDCYTECEIAVRDSFGYHFGCPKCGRRVYHSVDERFAGPMRAAVHSPVAHNYVAKPKGKQTSKRKG